MILALTLAALLAADAPPAQAGTAVRIPTPASPRPARAPSPVPPLVCPAGAAPAGARPFEGYEEWCERRDERGRAVREGPSRTYYDDGGLWKEFTWAGGKRTGPYVEYHRGGARAVEGTYIEDAKEGPWNVWYAEGGLEETSSWRHDFAQGPYASYWPSGKPKTAGRHCGGAQCGRWTSYDQDGRLIGTVDYGELSGTP